MRKIHYKDLLKFDAAEVRKITLSEQSFSIVADSELFERIQNFLKNEHDYQTSSKKLGDRLSYVMGGLNAMRLPNLMPIWNKATMDGFTVRVVKLGDFCEIIFIKPVGWVSKT